MAAMGKAAIVGFSLTDGNQPEAGPRAPTSALQRETSVVITRRTHAHCQIAAIESTDCFCTSGNSGYRSRKASATQPAPCY